MSIILFPLIAVALAQLLKLVFFSRPDTFQAYDLIAYSGMPSGHTAMVVSLATIVGLQEGIDSPLFGFSFVFAFLIIRDAVGLRQYLGDHGKMLNALVKDLKDDNYLDGRYPLLIEKIGHTPLQVLAGGLIGFAVSVAGYYLFL